MIPVTPLPDFRSPAFLRGHIEDTLSFYLPRAIDPTGGLFHFLRDDGSVYDAHTRHLVSSTRYVVTLAMGARRGLGGEKVRIALQKAFDFLPVHRNPDTAATPGCSTGATGRPACWTPPTTPMAWPSCCWPTPTRTWPA